MKRLAQSKCLGVCCINKDGWVRGYVAGRLAERMYGLGVLGSWVSGWTDGWMDDGWMDG